MNDNLFDQNKAASRRSDPNTSKEAATNIEASGKAGTQRRKIYEFVKHHPGLTSAEIAWELDLDRYIPSRRLPELKRSGLVATGTVRMCTRQKTKCMTWLPCVIEARKAGNDGA
jgi:predicted transcriptional regulator